VALNTASFSIIQSAIFGKLPFQDPGSLYSVQDPNRTGDGHFLTHTEYEDFRAQIRAFQEIAAFRAGFARQLELHLDARAGHAGGYAVSANFFHVLGVTPLLGRTITESDQRPGSTPAVVIGYQLWQSRFNARDDAIGSPLPIGGVIYTVVGIMPKGFWLPWLDGEFMVPLASSGAAPDGDDRNLSFIGRLSPSATPAQAVSEVALLGARLDKTAGRSRIKRWWRVVSLNEVSHPSDANAFYILQGVVACVLLVACANVSNLMLIRAAKRRRETAVRIALGATWWHVIQPVIAEGVLIVLAAVPLGALLTFATLHIIAATVASPATREILQFSISARMLTFLVIAAMTTLVVCVLGPALQTYNTNPNDVLKDDSSTGGTARRLQRWKGVSITVQFALSLMLLANTAILIRGVVRLGQWRPEFDAQHIYEMGIRPSERNSGGRDQILRRIVERVGAIPGVESIAATDRCLPRAGVISDDGRELPSLNCLVVTRDYLKTMQIPMREGRPFTDADINASDAVIVEGRLANRVWGTGSAIGRHLRFGDDASTQSMTVVGVIKHMQLQPPSSEVFNSAPVVLKVSNLDSATSPTLLIRVARASAPVAAIRSAIREIDPDQAVANLQPLDAAFTRSMAPMRWYAAMLGAFSVLALILAAVGLHGVVNYLAVQRTREIGIRIALGAKPRVIALLVMQGTMRYVAAGIVIGSLGAFLLAAVVASLLTGAQSGGALLPLITTTCLSALAALASFIPALRVANLSPAVALRAD
jgi:predicted permease